MRYSNSHFRLLFFFLLLFLVTNECMHAQLFGTRVKRYRSIKIIELDNNKQYVRISTHRTLIPKVVTLKEPATLWNLEGEGQAELIKIYGERFKKPNAFKKELQNEFFKKSAKLETDYTKRNVRLIFSIEKLRRLIEMNDKNGEFSLGDRIAYLKYSLTVDTGKIKFVKWNKFETEYKTLNIADITSTNSFNFTGGLTATSSTSKTAPPYADAASVTPSASASFSRSTSENQKVNNRHLALNGRLSEGRIEIEQEGTRDIDLAGNVAIEAQLEFEEISYEDLAIFSNLFSAGKPNHPKEVTLNILDVKVPNSKHSHEKIYAVLNGEYWYRHVSNAKGRKTFFEWDDRVEMFRGKIKGQKEELLEIQDYLPDFLNLKMKDSKSSVEAYLSLKNTLDELEQGSPRIITFSGFQAAEAFRSWLSQLTYVNKQKRSNLVRAINTAKNQKTPSLLKKAKKDLADFDKEMDNPIVFGNYYELTWNDKPLTLKELMTNPKERVRFNYFFDAE